MQGKIDRTYWVIYLLLIAFSVLSLFTSSSSLIHKATAAGLDPLQPILKQIMLLGVGVLFAYGIQYMPSWSYRALGYLLFAIGLLFLAINATHHGVQYNGAYRWIRVGSFTIQSSELAKIGLIIVVSDLLTRIRDRETEKRYYIAVLCLTLLTCGLIMIYNLSTAILLFTVVLLLMFLGKINWRWLAGLVAAIIVFLILGYTIVEFGYVRKDKKLTGPFARASVWVTRMDQKMAGMGKDDDAVKIDDSNLQVTLANVAVARGGQHIWGVGPGNSLERNRLPLAYMDYIFAIIVEETGLLGPLFLIFLYLSLLFRACYTSSRYDDYKAQLMVMGLGLMITLQALVSMLVAVDMGPVTGQPLPLITKGGTSAIITSIYFGVLMGVSREQEMLRQRERQVREESESNIPEIEL